MSKFEVDTKGFAQLQAGREPWRLAKELVSNSFDEQEVTKVIVDLQMRLEGAVLVVADDGPGFRDLNDAFTLYSYTYKRNDPTTRGRFNLGEKEIMALAKSGSVVTTSGSVYFTENGRQVQPSNKLRRGTTVTVTMDWTKSEMRDVIEKLQRLIPPAGKTYTVNGNLVRPRKTLYTV